NLPDQHSDAMYQPPIGSARPQCLGIADFDNSSVFAPTPDVLVLHLVMPLRTRGHGHAVSIAHKSLAPRHIGWMGQHQTNRKAEGRNLAKGALLYPQTV